MQRMCLIYANPQTDNVIELKKLRKINVEGAKNGGELYRNSTRRTINILKNRFYSSKIILQ
jgi:hypothetical protein